MIKNKKQNSIAIVAIVFLIALLFCSIAILMAAVQDMLYEDVEKNLQEIVIQNQEVINSRMQIELNSLNIAAKLMSQKLSSTADFTENNYLSVIEEYCNDYDDTDYFIANMSGMAFFSTALQQHNTEKNSSRKLDIQYREYYTLAKNGSINIKFIDSRLDGTNIFVLSMPMKMNNYIVGTVHKFYSLEEMYNICSLSLFSSNGFMQIINKKGEIIVQSDTFSFANGDKQFYRVLTAHGNAAASDRLQQDINNNLANSMRVEFNNNEYYCSYAPIEDVHEWYLITSISVNDMSSNANAVVLLFYIILVILTLGIGVSALLFILYKRKQQAVRDKIVFVDTVTGGNTYAKFLVEYQSILRDNINHNYHVVVFDIDNFKYVNSYFGYSYGDSVLKNIYTCVNEKLNQNELLARISGDTFILLMEGNSNDRLTDILNVQFDADKPIFISAGVYKLESFNEPISLMIDKATLAAESVKSLLVNKIGYYFEASYNELYHNEQIKREIGNALLNNEIIPYYQPKVDVNTRELVGAEALARWKKPDGHMISPAEFIPLCEKTGQIVDVDMAIFEQTLKFLANALNSGIKCVPISVNFSRVHLKNKDFVHKILSMIEQHCVPNNLIQIELTESIIFDDQPVMIDFVNHLHSHGLLVCIDDFGSGYSSLNMLKDLPVDVLKVDKSFLDVTDNIDRQMTILSVISHMARLLNIQVVLEGVETEKSVELMRKIGLTTAQGYYFARPMKEEDFEILFKRGVL